MQGRADDRISGQGALPRMPLSAVGVALVVALMAVIVLAERIGLPTRIAALTVVAVVVSGLVLLPLTAPTRSLLHVTGFAASRPGLAEDLGRALAPLAVLVLVMPLATAQDVMISLLALGLSAAAVAGGLVSSTDDGRHHVSLLDRIAEKAPLVRLILALLVLGVAGLLAATGLSIATTGLSAVTGLSPATAGAVAVIVLLLPVLVGGVGGGQLGACVIAIAVLGGILLPVIAGRVLLGGFPLPPFAEPDLLALIESERLRWFGNAASGVPPVLRAWSLALAGEQIAAILALAGVIVVVVHLQRPRGHGVGRARLRPAVMPAALAALALLSVVMVTAYAIEAAGLYVVGASAARPPAGLIEAGRLGLVEVCGRPAASVDAVREACGLAIRQDRPLAAPDLRLAPAFAWSGTWFALGLPVAGAVFIAIVPALLGLGLAHLGLAAAAIALGHDAIHRLLHPKALASWRIAIVRLSALAVALISAAAAHRFGADMLRALAPGALLLLAVLLAPLLPFIGRRRAGAATIWTVLMVAVLAFAGLWALRDFSRAMPELLTISALTMLLATAAGAVAMAISPRPLAPTRPDPQATPARRRRARTATAKA
jgi:hypothetical protein